MGSSRHREGKGRVAVCWTEVRMVRERWCCMKEWGICYEVLSVSRGFEGHDQEGWEGEIRHRNMART